MALPARDGLAATQQVMLVDSPGMIDSTDGMVDDESTAARRYQYFEAGPATTQLDHSIHSMHAPFHTGGQLEGSR